MRPSPALYARALVWADKAPGRELCMRRSITEHNAYRWRAELFDGSRSAATAFGEEPDAALEQALTQLGA